MPPRQTGAAATISISSIATSTLSPLTSSRRRLRAAAARKLTARPLTVDGLWDRGGVRDNGWALLWVWRRSLSWSRPRGCLCSNVSWLGCRARGLGVWCGRAKVFFLGRCRVSADDGCSCPRVESEQTKTKIIMRA
eukprot:2192247-Rhodomonas_salina.1